MDEAELQAAFAAYHAELDELPPPAERSQWQTAQQIATTERLAVITGTHPYSPVFLIAAARMSGRRINGRRSRSRATARRTAIDAVAVSWTIESEEDG